jgi:hypothetical protein
VQRAGRLVLAGALASSACGTGTGDLADLAGHRASDGAPAETPDAGPGPVENPRPVSGDRWRGCNLMGMYAIQWPETNQGFQELDFATVLEPRRASHWSRRADLRPDSPASYGLSWSLSPQDRRTARPIIGRCSSPALPSTRHRRL